MNSPQTKARHARLRKLIRKQRTNTKPPLPPAGFGRLSMSRGEGESVKLFDKQGSLLAVVNFNRFQDSFGELEVKCSVECPPEIKILRGELCQ